MSLRKVRASFGCHPYCNALPINGQQSMETVTPKRQQPIANDSSTDILLPNLPVLSAGSNSMQLNNYLGVVLDHLTSLIAVPQYELPKPFRLFDWWPRKSV